MRLIILVLLSTCFCNLVTSHDELTLTKWSLVSSSRMKDAGQVVSRAGYNASSWFPVTVPGTVFAGLVENSIYKEPFYGINLAQVDATQFDVPWWYRTEFNLLPNDNTKKIRVLFKGLNYRANIWYNGNLIADATKVVGTFRYFEFDLTAQSVFSSTNNALALEIFRPYNYAIGNDSSVDLAITFVDWAPPPPDSNMGIWQDVVIYKTGTLAVQYPLVQTELVSTDLARLTVIAQVTSVSDTVVNGSLSGEIAGIGTFSQPISLKPREVQQVIFTSDHFPALNVKNPALWWPWQMGDPTLHKLTLTVSVGSEASDSLNAQFGIREMTDELTDKNYRLYKVNKKPILIRGGGWSPDLFQRTWPDRQETEFKYTREMNLNTIRLEGKFENDNFFDLADKYGILIMPGICCCDSWQHWGHWKEEQYEIASESVRSQIRRLRIHASNLVFLYSSDLLPPVKVEQLYLDALSAEKWPNPKLSTASNFSSSITGPSGVKMSGPYSWVSPNYWLLDKESIGGAYAFLTEGGPGENPLSMDSFQITVPQDKLWPMNEYWNYHCGYERGSFGSLNYFTPPLEARHGKADSAEDYLQKGQVMAYEGHRAMFEGYGRNKYVSTGVIQWMLNNAFPEMIWHLYDYYLNPSATYFATKVACEPIHIQYSYDDDSIWVVNSLYTPRSSLVASVKVYTLNAQAVYSKDVEVPQIDSDGAIKILSLDLNSISNQLSNTFFVDLQLKDSSSAVVSRNLYWLSKQKDVLDWDHSQWFRTPCKSYADYTLLQTLPKVQLKVSLSNEKNSDGMASQVTVSNPSNAIAFFIHVRLVTSDKKDVWPIYWDDNYFTLFPGESRVVTAQLPNSVVEQIPEQNFDVIVEVFNNISGGK